MKWPWGRRRTPYTPLPPIIKPRPGPAPATEIEKRSRETASRIERSTNDLLVLLAELERHKATESQP